MRSPVVLRVLFVLVVAVLGSALRSQGWVDRTDGNGPPPMRTPAMCFDPIRGYTLMTGYYFTPGPFPSYVGVTWSWNGTTWAVESTAPSVSTQVQNSGQHRCAMVWSPSNNQVLMFGPGSTTNSVEVHGWTGSGWQSLASITVLTWDPKWVSAAYDPTRQETIAFYGEYSRVLVWTGTALTLRSATSPAILDGDSNYMAWDPTVQRIVLLGRQQGLVSQSKYYEWNGFGWNQRLPASPPRFGAVATDTARQRVIMFDEDHQTLTANHTWTIGNGTLNRLTTSLEPSLRQWSAMAFDSARGVCVLFGGLISGYPLADTWEFDLGPLASFTPYGTGCAGSRGIPTLAAQPGSLPRIGTTFTTIIGNLPWTGPAAMLLGLSNTSYGSSPLPLDLTFLGAPTCFLYTSIDAVENVTNVLGAASWSWTVPPFPGASFYAQVVPLDPGVNALGVTLSNAAHGVIGL